MWQWLLLSFVTFIVIAGCPLDNQVLCPSCVDKNRDNARCEWIGDTPLVIDPSNRANQRHLVQDAQLAEGLAVRFADAEHGRRFGIDHHGGLVDNGAVRRGCMARMVSAIATTHAVTAAQVQRARTHRPAGFDATVNLLFLPLYGVVCLAACRALDRRFAADGCWVRILATALASVVAALLGCYLLVLWSMPWEAIRVGNGHIGGFRLATYNRHTLGAPLVLGVAVFWSMAVFHRSVPQQLMMGAASMSCALLAAMFARTFGATTIGYLLPLVALLACVLGLAAAVCTPEEASTPRTAR